MGPKLFGNIVLMIVLVLAQVLVCNHVMLFGGAVVSMPMKLNTDWLLTWAFVSGLLVDVFVDIPGVNALSCTLLAMMKRPVLYAYIPRDDHTKNVVPSLSTLGFAVYAKYLLSMSALYCVMVFTIEYFSFASVKEIVIMSAASAVFTFLILLAIDSLIISRREKRL